MTRMVSLSDYFLQKGNAMENILNNYKNVRIEKMPELANKILEYFNLKYSMPVPIVKIMKELGFVVVGKILESNLSGIIGISNKLKSKYGTNKVICLNINDSIGHKRFAMAHELGHFLVDYNKSDYYDVYFANERADLEEEERANCFAANLLMSKDIFEDMYKKFDDNNRLYHLTKHFRVSYTAVYKRIDELNLK